VVVHLERISKGVLMEEGIIKTVPDREKAKSILKMMETTLEMKENH
jgi:hypothetical protein